MLKKLLFSVLLLPTLCLADNPPPPPTLHDLDSTTSCSAYTSRVADYLSEHADVKFEDLMNAMWFSDFSENTGTPYYHEHCENNICTVNYDGGDHGCYVAGIAQSKPIQQLYTILTSAYDNAIRGVSAGNLGRFGFNGTKNQC